MKETVYLIVKDMGVEIETQIIALANARNEGVKGYTPLEEGDTYQTLHDKYYALRPIKGCGGVRLKDGEEHWVLPFYSHPQMIEPESEDVTVLDSKALRSFGWDVEEIS